MGSPFLITAVVVFVALLAIAYLWQRSREANSFRLDKRIKDAGQNDGTQVVRKGAAGPSNLLLDNKQNETVLDSMFKVVGTDTSKLRSKLRRGGLQMTPVEYIILNAVLLVVMVAAAGLLLPQTLRFYGMGVAAVLALFAVSFWLNRRVDKRIGAFNRHFPDALELMVRGLRTGLPITECIKAVSKDMPDPVGSEFAKIRDDLRLGMGMGEASWKAAEHLQTQEFNFFALSVGIQSEMGGNLAETLDKLAEVLRNRQQILRMIKAKSSEARMTAWILGALPFVMFTIISLSSPGYTEPLYTDPRGQKLSMLGLVWMGLGVIWLRKMTRFDF